MRVVLIRSSKSLSISTRSPLNSAIEANSVKNWFNISNKFYHINKQISLDSLNLGFVHLKKIDEIPVFEKW